MSAAQPGAPQQSAQESAQPGATQHSGLLDRHIGFLEALRAAGLPVSLAEGLDAVSAVAALTWDDRERVRTGYAATMVKKQSHRPTFDAIFDLYFPRLVGHGAAGRPGEPGSRDSAASLEDLRERLGEALEADLRDDGEEGERPPSDLQELAAEAVGRFGEMPGRAPGQSGWSAYNTLRRVAPGDLVDRLVTALLERGRTDAEAERGAARQVAAFTRLVEEDARRRIAQERDPGTVADLTLRPSVDRLDFTAAHRSEVDEMRRALYPLSRRLAARLAKEQHARRRGPLDVRRTVRASLSTGGVPLTTHHRPRRPHRPELVVLCDVSGSVANFAQFTLLLVFALREQFSALRAFTFIDDVTEVTDAFDPQDDPGEVMARLTESAAYAARFGRTDYGRAFRRFVELHGDALGPKTSLLVLGDARSNYSDLGADVLRDMVSQVRNAWWFNPEHPRQWGAGDSAARVYGEIVPMRECRNLTQLTEVVHDLL